MTRGDPLERSGRNPNGRCSPAQTQAAVSASPLLADVAEQVALPARTWTASGTHTAKGYTTEAAETTSVEGMKADCDNIDLDKELTCSVLA